MDEGLLPKGSIQCDARTAKPPPTARGVGGGFPCQAGFSFFSQLRIAVFFAMCAGRERRLLASRLGCRTIAQHWSVRSSAYLICWNQTHGTLAYVRELPFVSSRSGLQCLSDQEHNIPGERAGSLGEKGIHEEDHVLPDEGLSIPFPTCVLSVEIATGDSEARPHTPLGNCDIAERGPCSYSTFNPKISKCYLMLS